MKLFKLGSLAALISILLFSATPASADRGDRDDRRSRYERHERFDRHHRHNRYEHRDRFDRRHDRGWQNPRRDDRRADYYARPSDRGLGPRVIYPNRPYGPPRTSYYSQRPYNGYSAKPIYVIPRR